jgi:hypothetical protein
MNLSSVKELQSIERDAQGKWRRMEAPLNGLPLKMNLPYIKKVGFTTASDVSNETIESTGYVGAIHLRNGKVTYLYR